MGMGEPLDNVEAVIGAALVDEARLLAVLQDDGLAVPNEEAAFETLLAWAGGRQTLPSRLLSIPCRRQRQWVLRSPQRQAICGCFL